jgi:hypothetical protein
VSQQVAGIAQMVSMRKTTRLYGVQDMAHSPSGSKRSIHLEYADELAG